MMNLFVIVALLFGVTAIVFIEERPRFAVLMMAFWLAVLASLFQQVAGVPAGADGRLAAEPWRLLSVAPLADNRFLIAVRYANGGLRTYDLSIADPGARDEFLKAQQALKKGKPMMGRAQRSRAGLEDDSDMGFGFSEAPETEPKAHSS